MSSKSAGARAGRELVYYALNLIATGRLGEVPPPKRWYLTRRGYIARKGKRYSVLPAGKRVLSESAVWSASIPTPKKWDGKWRLVVFDIPAGKRKRRDIFRIRLRELGLVLYQRSVWIYPYPLEDAVKKLAIFYGLGKCVSFVTAERLTGEKALRLHFKLPIKFSNYN